MYDDDFLNIRVTYREMLVDFAALAAYIAGVASMAFAYGWLAYVGWVAAKHP